VPASAGYREPDHTHGKLFYAYLFKNQEKGGKNKTQLM